MDRGPSLRTGKRSSFKPELDAFRLRDFTEVEPASVAVASPPPAPLAGLVVAAFGPQPESKQSEQSELTETRETNTRRMFDMVRTVLMG